jgi:hypothetical protein
MENKVHIVEGLTFSKDFMKIKIDGKLFKFELGKISDRLLKANKNEREKFTISPSGYGINWPLIDEDLSVDGLLKIEHALENVEAA